MSDQANIFHALVSISLRSLRECVKAFGLTSLYESDHVRRSKVLTWELEEVKEQSYLVRSEHEKAQEVIPQDKQGKAM